MSFARRERLALVETMRAVGPSAPTLCGSWTVRDLAAHLLLRERRLDAVVGIFVPLLSAHTRKVQDKIAAEDWTVILAQLAARPPLWSPVRWGGAVANSLEMFVHHEDVRRAQEGWQPRTLSRSAQSWLLLYLPIAKYTYRKSEVRVELHPHGGPRLVAKRRGSTRVRLSGDPAELLLHAVGRNRVELTVSGAPVDVVAVHAVSRSV